jgi:hypothetical protein
MLRNIKKQNTHVFNGEKLMASRSEVESCFSVLGAGLAGLRLLKVFGLRSTELDLFIKTISTEEQVKICAFAPSPLREQYKASISEAQRKVKHDIEGLSVKEPSDKAIDDTIKDTTQLYGILAELHRTAVSGLVI